MAEFDHRHQHVVAVGDAVRFIQMQLGNDVLRGVRRWGGGCLRLRTEVKMVHLRGDDDCKTPHRPQRSARRLAAVDTVAPNYAVDEPKALRLQQRQLQRAGHLADLLGRGAAANFYQDLVGYEIGFAGGRHADVAAARLARAGLLMPRPSRLARQCRFGRQNCVGQHPAERSQKTGQGRTVDLVGGHLPVEHDRADDRCRGRTNDRSTNVPAERRDPAGPPAARHERRRANVPARAGGLSVARTKCARDHGDRQYRHRHDAPHARSSARGASQYCYSTRGLVARHG